MRIADADEFLEAYRQVSRNAAGRQRQAFRQLLDEAAPVYARLAADRRSTARRFNVFEALGIERRELMHSGLLAYLLNPRAQHDQGDRMLRSFLERMGIEALPQTLERTTVVCEHSLEERGRLDIALFLPNGRIVGIENKVDAGERPDQVRDYQLWLSQQQRWVAERHLLVFLTPEGRAPDKQLAEIDLRSCSYETIADWLSEHRDLPNRLATVVAMYAEICRQIGRSR